MFQRGKNLFQERNLKIPNCEQSLPFRKSWSDLFCAFNDIWMSPKITVDNFTQQWTSQPIIYWNDLLVARMFVVDWEIWQVLRSLAFFPRTLQNLEAVNSLMFSGVFTYNLRTILWEKKRYTSGMAANQLLSTKLMLINDNESWQLLVIIHRDSSPVR